MTREIKFGNKLVGDGYPTYVIAEIGINHNGNLEIAKKMIDAAVHAGVDAVKFQKRTIDIVYTKEFLDSPRESPWGTTQRAQKEGLEFSANQYKEIDEFNKKEFRKFETENKDFVRKYNKIKKIKRNSFWKFYKVKKEISSLPITPIFIKNKISI